MKKTILALTVTSLFAGSAMAKVIHRGEVKINAQEAMDSIGTVTEIDGAIELFDKEGNSIAQFTTNENGSFNVISLDGQDVESGRATINKHGEIDIAVSRNGNFETANIARDDVFARGEVETSVKRYAETHGLSVNEHGHVHDADGNQVGQVEFDQTGKITVTEFGSDGKNQVHEVTNYSNDRVQINSKEVSDMPTPKPLPDVEDADRDQVINEFDRQQAMIKQNADWARQAEVAFQQEVARLDSKIDTMEGRVSNGSAMVGAMSQMQFGHSGLGIGAGVAEFNGSKAVAVGVGYAFGAEKEWMAKGSFGYAESKKGKGSKDTMAAAGLTYSFK